MTPTYLKAEVLPQITHQAGCEHADGFRPGNECDCLCYEIGIFNAALKAAAQVVADDKHLGDDEWNKRMNKHCDRLAGKLAPLFVEPE